VTLHGVRLSEALGQAASMSLEDGGVMALAETMAAARGGFVGARGTGKHPMGPRGEDRKGTSYASFVTARAGLVGCATV
jgi:hypothetical protein